MPSMSAGLSPASAIALSAASACSWICDMSGMTAEVGGLGGADDGDRFRLHRDHLRAGRERGGDLVVELFEGHLDRHVELRRLGVCGQSTGASPPAAIALRWKPTAHLLAAQGPSR